MACTIFVSECCTMSLSAKSELNFTDVVSILATLHAHFSSKRLWANIRNYDKNKQGMNCWAVFCWQIDTSILASLDRDNKTHYLQS